MRIMTVTMTGGVTNMCVSFTETVGQVVMHERRGMLCHRLHFHFSPYSSSFFSPLTGSRSSAHVETLVHAAEVVHLQSPYHLGQSLAAWCLAIPPAQRRFGCEPLISNSHSRNGGCVQTQTWTSYQQRQVSNNALLSGNTKRARRSPSRPRVSNRPHPRFSKTTRTSHRRGSGGHRTIAPSSDAVWIETGACTLANSEDKVGYDVGLTEFQGSDFAPILRGRRDFRPAGKGDRAVKIEKRIHTLLKMEQHIALLWMRYFAFFCSSLEGELRDDCDEEGLFASIDSIDVADEGKYSVGEQRVVAVAIPPSPAVPFDPAMVTLSRVEQSEGLYREIAAKLSNVILAWSSIGESRHLLDEVLRKHQRQGIWSNNEESFSIEGSIDGSLRLTSSSSSSSRSYSRSAEKGSRVGDQLCSIKPDKLPVPLHAQRAEMWLDSFETLRCRREELFHIAQQRIDQLGDGGPANAASENYVVTHFHQRISATLRDIANRFFRHPVDDAVGNVQKGDCAAWERMHSSGGGKFPSVPHPVQSRRQYGPSSELFRSVLTAYHDAWRYDQMHTTKTMETMEGIVRKMELSHSGGNRDAGRPDLDMFHTLMKHYVPIGTKSSARKCDALLQRMDAESRGRGFEDSLHGSALGGGDEAHVSSRSSSPFCSPNAESLKLVMRAYKNVRERNPSYAFRVLEIIERMEQHINGATSEKQGNRDRGRRLSRRRRDRLHHHRRSLDSTSLAPDTEAYNICLRAFRDHGGGMKDDVFLAKTVDIIKRMKRSDVSGDGSSAPNATTYILAIAVLSESSDPRYFVKAQETLLGLEKNYASCRRTALTLAQKGEGADARTFPSADLDSCVSPRTAMYNSILSAIYTKLNSKEDVFSMEKMLNKMVSQQYSKPDYNTFRLMFRILAKASVQRILGDAVGQQADCLLSRMEVQHATGNNLVKPDTATYIQAIRCWKAVASNEWEMGNGAKGAWNILRRMEEQEDLGNADVEATRYAYNLVIHTCSATRDPDLLPEALRIAFDCYNKMISRGVFPNSVTFGLLLFCCERLLPDKEQRADLAKKVFDAACEQGQVDRSVMRSLKKASPQLFHKYKLIPSHSAKGRNSWRIERGEITRKTV